MTGEHLTAGTVTGEARLDVSARNFWSPLAKAFVDIRVFHPMAPSNASKSIPAMYISHEIIIIIIKIKFYTAIIHGKILHNLSGASAL